MTTMNAISMVLNIIGRKLRGYMLFHFDLIDSFLKDIPLHPELAQIATIAHRLVIMKVALHYHRKGFDPDEPPFDVEALYEKISPPPVLLHGKVVFSPNYWKGYIDSAYKACGEWLANETVSVLHSGAVSKQEPSSD